MFNTTDNAVYGVAPVSEGLLILTNENLVCSLSYMYLDGTTKRIANLGHTPYLMSSFAVESPGWAYVIGNFGHQYNLAAVDIQSGFVMWFHQTFGKYGASGLFYDRVGEQEQLLATLCTPNHIGGDGIFACWVATVDPDTAMFSLIASLGDNWYWGAETIQPQGAFFDRVSRQYITLMMPSLDATDQSYRLYVTDVDTGNVTVTNATMPLPPNGYQQGEGGQWQSPFVFPEGI
eukprot:TRINITY_DN6866_c0_g1_i1.p1 TRINITY_DN6866_c0_g1~~TRINITY_DN6866_c0_g1_i1.p1  ORF type:complete len:233 (+),score=32.70 TRINITY_DN6866_c0_g1_i1:494-1192(+)